MFAPAPIDRPDNSGRVALLSSRVPEHLAVDAGDAVRVPFGKRYVHGMVTGASEPDKATADIEPSAPNFAGVRVRGVVGCAGWGRTACPYQGRVRSRGVPPCPGGCPAVRA